MKSIIVILVALGLVVSIGWGCTMLGKYLSYKFFYEAQVRETVHQVLREEHLK